MMTAMRVCVCVFRVSWGDSSSQRPTLLCGGLASLSLSVACYCFMVQHLRNSHKRKTKRTSDVQRSTSFSTTFHGTLKWECCFVSVSLWHRPDSWHVTVFHCVTNSFRSGGFENHYNCVGNTFSSHKCLYFIDKKTQNKL